ncbi:MAG: hypothetical protein M3Q65_24160, partial [Chloroflexota bacterium]|nr:hypothetical protein [Chloroflexota bacterium]
MRRWWLVSLGSLVVALLVVGAAAAASGGGQARGAPGEVAAAVGAANEAAAQTATADETLTRELAERLLNAPSRGPDGSQARTTAELLPGQLPAGLGLDLPAPPN